MNVEVVRSRVIRIALEHGFQHRDQLERARRRLAIKRPELPGPQHHQALGEHGGCIEVVRVFFRQLPHRFAVIEVELLPVRFRVRRPVALRQRADVVLLASTCLRRALKRLLHGVVSGFRAGLINRGIVVVRPDGKREAPVRHGGFRVELRGVAKITRGFVVVETVEKRQSLIEVGLCFSALCRDRMVVVAQPGVKLNPFCRSTSMLVLCHCGGNTKCQNTNDCYCSHSLSPFLF